MRDATLEAERQRVADVDRRIAAARARVERIGGMLHVMGGADGRPGFMVSRWTFMKDLPDIEAVERWLAQVESRA